MRFRLAASLIAALSLPVMAAEPITTHAERSGFTQTGRYAEVESLCTAYAERWPDAVRCETFGRTPEGRPMLALVASRSGALTAADARRRGTPVLLVQGGIHAGEIDGKDAGFLALREMLDGTAAKGALERVVVVFVPVFNVDGHERTGRWNRPNQRGPEEMGWRTTAQNLNLNRDYVKADAPEMQAMLRLVDAWDPIAYTDLHVTDGAQFEHDISINLEPSHSGDPGLRKAGVALRDALLADLTRQGSLPLPFYPSFVEYDNPASGFEDNVATPRFSHGYFPLRNRFGVLVETHSWKDYPTRVRITRNTIVALVEHAAKDGARWRVLATKADAAAAQLGGTVVPLDYKATDKARTIAFRGYAYTRTPSEVSGALMTRYDERTPQVWNIPLRDDVQPQLQVTAPRGGYIVPPAHAALVSAWLTRHGITFRTLDAARPHADVEVFRATKATFGTGTVEGHQRLALEGRWQHEPRDIPAGALYVPIAQPKARLVVAILEPQAPDSIAAWGGFNTAFERKEYMEEYVAEDVARAMLRDDPAVAKAFNERLATDEAFARSPAARLEFFARRHSSWDERLDLYPVMRSDVEPH
ncbi:M14 family zinc carboxypeptidase [Dokdonella sp. MW10]|uniref:M14 family zinc carboxypeptidase n=1 Tax=Dokdonella sp. MW10 TaxID=2992926 RepID=UPI003F7DD8FD